MIRNAFTMKIKKGCEAEYKKRHDEIWPELEKLLADSGIKEYVIYLDEATGTLFAFQKLSDSNKTDELTRHAVIWKWWKYMADIMDTNDDYSPVSFNLKEMYCMRDENKL